MVERNGRRRLVGASALLCAGLILSTSTEGVSARVGVVIEQATPLDGPMVGDSIGSGSGSNASLSGDGRYVAYQAIPTASDDPSAPVDSRSDTIYLTDRDAGVTAEVTTVPEGQRSGNSVHPVLSGDGCSIVVVTEMALDVFRDDDTGDRWDVYRLQLPHCGGTLGAWELVSTRPDGSGLARDDVSIVDTPAVSRSGTLIAYTHPASQSIEEGEVTSVSLVNLEVPVTDPSRSALVAGTPISTPDTQFVHAGLDQPAISGDGRFVAYRSDAASNDAVPGWGTGVTPGGPATRQIYVWDRNEADPFLAVRLVSVRVDGEPTVVGASDPVLSRDGRVVAFTSADVGLVPAVLPACGGGCPTQVFRLDRDIDANGIYDEVSRTAMKMVSSVEGSDPVVAGTASSSQPALSAEGQLVAFITKASNLQLVEASGGGESDDGDLLVADAARGTLRRIAVAADGVRPAVAAHSRPQLSDTGRTTAFDTLAGPQLAAGSVPGRQVVAISTPPTLSIAEADVGSTLVGFTSDEYFVAVINNGPTTFTPSTVTVSNSEVRHQPERGHVRARSSGASWRRLYGAPDLHARCAGAGVRHPHRCGDRLRCGQRQFHGSRHRWRSDVARKSWWQGPRHRGRRAGESGDPVRCREHLVGTDVGVVDRGQRSQPGRLRDRQQQLRPARFSTRVPPAASA